MSFLKATGISGFLMGLSLLFLGATTLIVGKISDELSNRSRVAIPATVVIAVGFGFFTMDPTLWTMLIGVSLIGAGVGGTSPPLMAYLGDISARNDVGKLGGFYSMLGDLGGTLGALVAIPLAAEIGFKLEYTLCILLVAIAGALIAFTLSEPLPHDVDIEGPERS